LASSDSSLLISIVTEIFTSPLNLFLLGLCFVLIYKIFKGPNGSSEESAPAPPSIPKLRPQDMTLQQLKKYDGTDEVKRICVAVNGKIFDVTRSKNYGPGGPYHAFAGRDATRSLATFDLKNIKEDFDDLSDLSSMQMDSVREWEMQFTEKYDYVGKLLKPGEQPTEYSDDEEQKEAADTKDSSSASKKDE